MKTALLSLCFLFSIASFRAQTYYNDAQLRVNLALEKRITKKLSVSIDQQDRFYKNMGEFSRSAFDFGINLKVNKWLKLKADYVLISKRNKHAIFTERNWFYLAAIFKYEMNKFKFFYRNIAQVRMGVTCMSSNQSELL